VDLYSEKNRTVPFFWDLYTKFEEICFSCEPFLFTFRVDIYEEKMRLLSRKEEIILLAVWKLENKEGAYGVPIRSYIEEMTGIRWLFGAIYAPLGRLVDYGYVESYESDPLPERGGRRKTLYRLTEAGKEALLEVKAMNSCLWGDIPPLVK
jgi:DNA-binding PadR family transcriptional regulator